MYLHERKKTTTVEQNSENYIFLKLNNSKCVQMRITESNIFQKVKKKLQMK